MLQVRAVCVRKLQIHIIFPSWTFADFFPVVAAKSLKKKKKVYRKGGEVIVALFFAQNKLRALESCTVHTCQSNALRNLCTGENSPMAVTYTG